MDHNIGCSDIGGESVKQCYQRLETEAQLRIQIMSLIELQGQ